MLLNLIKNASNLNVNANEEDIYEFNSISLLIKANMKSQINMKTISTYNIEISLQSSPIINNFYDSFIITVTDDDSSNKSQLNYYNSSQCLYNYNFSLDQYKASLFTASFIKLETSVGSECATPFNIDNTGCLSLNVGDKCLDTKENSILLNAGSYTIRFKLCYNDSSKISCSSIYNQTIIVEKNVYNSSMLSTRLDEQIHTTKLKVFRLLKTSNQSIILIVLLVTILFIALITILALIYYYFRTKLKRREEKNFCEKAFVLSNRGGSASSSETSSDSGMNSQMHSSSNTPETSSNVTTDSSKISKLDDEVAERIYLFFKGPCPLRGGGFGLL
jgi:hypothetical protein